MTDKALADCPHGKVEVVLTQQVGLLALVDEKGHVVATQFLDGGASHDAMDNLAEAWNRRAPQSKGSERLREAMERLDSWALNNRRVLMVSDIEKNNGESKYVVDYADLFFFIATLRNEGEESAR